MIQLSLNDLVYGDILSRSLRLALKFKIFDCMDTKKSVEEISSLSGLPEDILKNLLHMFAEYKIIERDSEGYWNSNESTRYLSTGGESYLGQQLEFFHSSVFPQFEEKILAAEKGKLKPLKENTPAKKLKAAFYKNNKDMQNFSEYASLAARRAGEELAEKFDFSQITKIADLGGNDGSFLVPILQRHSHLKGLTIDLPVLADVAISKRSQDTNKDQWSYCGVDFFEEDLPPSDCYSCGFVFHDWNDIVADEILSKISKALLKHGILILHENLLDDPDPGKRLTFARTHFLLVMMSYGSLYASGDKSSVEYKTWLKKHDLEVSGIIHGSGKSFVIAQKI